METQVQEDGSKPAASGDGRLADASWQRRALTVLAGLHFRIVATFIVSAATVALIADLVHPYLAMNSYKQLAVSLAAQADRQQSSSDILQALRQHNLAWYYITDEKGEVTAATKPFSPNLEAPVKTVSHEEKWLGKRYFEAVAVLATGKLLHVGFYISPMLFSQLDSPYFAIEPCPLGPLLLVFFGTLAGLLAVIHTSVVAPADRLAQATRGALDASFNPPESADLAAAVSEIKSLADAVFSLQSRLIEKLTSTASAGASALANEGSDGEAAAQSRIAEFYSRDAEEEFILVLGRELDALKSSHQLCQRVLDKLNDKFPTSIVHGVLFKAQKDQRFAAEAFLGFDDRTVQTIKRLDHQRIASEAFGVGTYLSLSAESMRDYGLQSLLSCVQVKSVVYLPLSFQSRNLGMLAVYFRTEGKTVQDRLRFLRNASTAIARSLYEVIIYEEELQAALTDPLTGVRNRKFLQELLPKVFARAAANPFEQPLTLLMIHGDHFKDIQETCGHGVSDQMLQALAQTVRQCVRTSDGDGRDAPGDFLIRYGNEEFALLMEATDAAHGLAIAERIRNSVSQKADWPGGITKWSVSAGAACYPHDTRNIEDLLAKTNTALHYVKGELGGNKVCHIKQVPDGYTVGKETAAIGGELGVFDPAALLQSLSTAQKTGILTVLGRQDSQLWMLFEGGRPVQAKLGKFGGAMAIVEFVTTFEEGNFNFQEKLFGPKETITKLPRLDSTYNVEKGLERCLMDGALALDNYNAARAVITSAEIMVRPIAAVEFSARWQALAQLPDPPTQEEFSIMSDIVQHADGKTSLQTIFLRMDTVQTARLWRAAALLVQHGLVSKLSGLPV